MLWLLYNLLFPIVLLLLLPHFIFRMRRRGGYGKHFMQRFAIFSAEEKARLKEGNWIWIHAVSVGEIYVALSFIRIWRARRPDARFMLSITTSTANRIARDRLDDRDLVVYFPVDFPPVMRRMLRLVRPRALVLVESEFWPNLIRGVHRSGAPVALINGRISDRSFPRYRKVPWITRPVFRLMDAFCMQSEKDQARILELGAPVDRVHQMNSAKYEVATRDAEKEQASRAVLQRAGFDPAAGPILMGGSTWPGEEKILAAAYRKLKPQHPGLKLLLVPRHAERIDAVTADLDAEGLRWVRKSQEDTHDPEGGAEVFILDTTGELLHYYAAADLIFVGKSLRDTGGQNIIEPALFGKAVLTGPNMQNFPLVMREFNEARAIRQVADAEELEAALAAFLADPAAAEAMGERAGKLVAAKAGAMTRTVTLLQDLVEAAV